MALVRSFLLLSFCLAFLSFPTSPSATPTPVGILTQAHLAHVDSALAFPGLSVFDGEQLSTEAQGQMAVRVGHSVLTLGGNTTATILQMTGGVHVDLSDGSLFFNGTPEEVAEVHVGEAVLRTVSREAVKASFVVLAPKVLQVAAQKGGLSFSYREEKRFLPEGQTYRIYLDAPEEPQVDAVSNPKAGMAGKVAYFIIGGAVGGGAALGIHAAASGNPPISPDKP